MARGLGKMFGFDFPVNFDHPYQSRSISEFWRRWHITLGAWFREYLYIPLGGNRRGKARTYLNLVIVWLLTGFWHGASFNFIFWGLFYGILIIAERAGFSKVLEKLPSSFSMLYTFLMVMFGWIMFDLDTMSGFFAYLRAMFTGKFFDSLSLYQLSTYGVMFVICIFASTDLFRRLCDRLAKNGNAEIFLYGAAPVMQILLLLLCTCYLVDASYNPFLYFRF